MPSTPDEITALLVALKRDSEVRSDYATAHNKNNSDAKAQLKTVHDDLCAEAKKKFEEGMMDAEKVEHTIDEANKFSLNISTYQEFYTQQINEFLGQSFSSANIIHQEMSKLLYLLVMFPLTVQKDAWQAQHDLFMKMYEAQKKVLPFEDPPKDNPPPKPR